jgi:DNA end-binding protein Ku
VIKLSFVVIPVKAYPAACTSHKVHFNQLHAGCGQRIRYEKHCPTHGKVEAGAIVSGYAYAPDQYVVIDPAELEALRPARERALCLERFLDAQEVDPALFSGRTLYLLPDGLAAQHAFGVLTQALKDRHKWALGRVVLGGHRVFALVRPSGPVLALHVLHFPEEVRSTAGLPLPSQAQPASAEEQHLAGLLVDAATKPVSWTDYRDDTAEQVRALIQSKLDGCTPTAPASEEVPILQLVDALKRSVAQVLQQPTGQQPASLGNQEVTGSPPSGKRKPTRKSARRSA